MYLSRKEEFLKMSSILNELLNKIKIIQKNIEYPSKFNKDLNLENKTIIFIKHLEQQILKNIESINELKNPFLLFVIGSGNYGKSTIVNSLLGQKIITTNDLPNTWKIDLFIKSDIEKMEITYQDSNKVTKSLHSGIKSLKKEEEKFKESKKYISSILKNYKKDKQVDIPTLKNYKKELESKYLYKSNIVQVRYFLNKSGILDDFILVDTPGLNQNLLKNTVNRMKEYYLRSDGVIWILDAQNIVSKESNTLIEEITQMNNLYDNNKSMIAVINKMDIIHKNDKQNTIKIKNKANQIYKDKFTEIVFISAKKAINGIVSDNEEFIYDSNINDLINCINEKFKEVSQESQIKSKYQNLKIMKDCINNEINNYKRQLYKDISKYNEGEFDLYEKIKNIRIYIVEHLNKLKNDKYICDLEFRELKSNLKSIEDMCNLNLEKLYDSLYIKSNFNKNKEIKQIDFRVNFSKSKYIILDYKTKVILSKTKEKSTSLSRILSSFDIEQSKKSTNNQNYIKKLLISKIDNIVKDCIKSLDEQLNFIEITINELREKSFENKYIEYELIKEHIKNINDIDITLKNLG
ncbi:dynamin family protein [Romboutsia maritimum]|uniref:dynamin family protein n=1 Tax=Romboutsia maritimum TaxID=2020948 RepID=UPI0013140437|nr:dynamin family protein [Romboutsia maritimum]